MADPKIISRLRKLLALARSGDNHETRAARLTADAFMTRHGLREQDADDVLESDVVEVPLGADGFGENWKWRLVTLAARYHRCEALGLRVSERRKVRVVGLRDDAVAAAAFFNATVAGLRELARSEMRGVVARARRDYRYYPREEAENYLRWWREGVVDGLAVRIARSVSFSGGDTEEREVEVREVEASDGVLVRIVSPASSVRDRVASFAARESVEVDDCDFIGDVNEEAYASGFRQSSQVQLPGREGDS